MDGRNECSPTQVWGSLAAGSAAAPVLARFLLHVTAKRQRAGVPAGVWRNRRFLLSLMATALIEGLLAAYYSSAPL
jgi:hypothetical protein